MEEEKKKSNDQIEKENKGDKSEGEKTTHQKMKELEQKLSHIKLSDEERERMRGIFEEGGEKENENIGQFLRDLKEKHTGYFEKRDIKQLAPLYDTHDFWDSQPVPKENDKVNTTDFDKAIDVDRTVEEIRAEPLDIPAGFYWSNVNISNDEEAKEVYDLLTQNYVEDDGNNFRFDYSVQFLQWALTPPGFNPDWLFGVRGGKKNKLFGFISGIPVVCYMNGKEIKKAEINFLCVHKNLRTKRLAPVLIKEVTRRVNRCN